MLTPKVKVFSQRMRATWNSQARVVLTTLATSKDLDTHLGAYAYDPPTVQFLREVEPMMADNVAMLGAKLQRSIMDRVESGMSLEDAVANTSSWHAETVSG